MTAAWVTQNRGRIQTYHREDNRRKYEEMIRMNIERMQQINGKGTDMTIHDHKVETAPVETPTIEIPPNPYLIPNPDLRCLHIAEALWKDVYIKNGGDIKEYMSRVFGTKVDRIYNWLSTRNRPDYDASKILAKELDISEDFFNYKNVDVVERRRPPMAPIRKSGMNTYEVILKKNGREISKSKITLELSKTISYLVVDANYDL